MTRRVERLNSLLKQVLSEVIRKEVKNPHLPSLITVTRVSITKDLHHAKVYISVIGDEKKRQEALRVLHSAAGFIAIHASKKIVLRYFPELTFLIDESLDQQLRIEALIHQIEEERQTRE